MNRTVKILIADPRQERRAALVGKLAGDDAVDIASVTHFPPEDRELDDEAPDVFLCPERPDTETILRYCTMLKARKPAMPVVVYTRDMSEGLRLRFLEAGVDRFMPTSAIPDTLQQIHAAADSSSNDAKTHAPTESASTQQNMYLKLGQGELANAIQFLTMTPRTGLLKLTFPDTKTEGSIYVDGGQVVHAECEDTAGTEAFAVMLAKPRAEAEFFNDITTDNRTVEATVDHLLLDASVMADEITSVQERVPLDGVPVKQEAAMHIDDLEEDARAVLDAVNGTRTVQDIVGQVSMSATHARFVLAILQDSDLITWQEAAREANP